MFLVKGGVWRALDRTSVSSLSRNFSPTNEARMSMFSVLLAPKFATTTAGAHVKAAQSQPNTVLRCCESLLRDG